VTGCNQKSNRDPMMELDDFGVEKALDELRNMGAVMEVDWVGRVAKFKHQAYEWLAVSKVELAVMAELLLRGAQSLGDLRARAARMEPIADLAELRPIVAGLMERNLMIALTPPGRGQVVSHNLYLPDELAALRPQAGAPRATSAPASTPDPIPAHATRVRWEDLPRERLGPLLERRYITGRNLTLAQFFLAKGCVVPAHEHESEQFAHVLQGCLRFRLGADGNEVVDVSAGEVLMIPSRLPHAAEALEDSVVADSFSPVRGDWLAKDDGYLRR